MRLWQATYVTPVNGEQVLRSGDFYLASADEVRRAIVASGGYTVSISERRTPWWRSMTGKGQRDGIHLLQSVAFHAETMSPVQALTRVIETDTNAALRVTYMPARAVLGGGGDFVEALRSLGLFDPTTLAMVSAGEKSNTLRETVAFAVEQMRARKKQFKQMVGLFGWIAMDIQMIISGLHAVESAFIPMLRDQGIKTRDEATRIAFENGLANAQLLNQVLLLLTYVVIATGLVLGISYWKNKNNYDHPSVRMVQGFPGLKSYFDDLAMAASWAVFSRLLMGKVMIGEAFKIVHATTWSFFVREYWEKSRQALLAGTPREALARPPLDEQERMQISSHVSSEQLAKVAGLIAERRSEMSVKRQKRLILMTMIGSFIYMGVSFANMAYLAYLQNTSAMEAINYLKQGAQ